MIPVDVYEQLTTSRRNAVAQGNASLRAEGLEPPPEIEVIVDQWVHGQLSTSEMEDQVAALYQPRPE